MQHPLCTPEIGWQKHPFVQNAGWCFGTVHCDIAPQQCCVQESFQWKVIGSNLNGRKDSVNSHHSEPSATRQRTPRLCGVSPTCPRSLAHTRRRSQSVKSHDFARSQRKIPMTNGRDTRSAAAAVHRVTWSGQLCNTIQRVAECGMLRLVRIAERGPLRLMTVIVRKNNTIHKQTPLEIPTNDSQEPHRNTVRSAPTILPHASINNHCESVDRILQHHALDSAFSQIVGERERRSLCTMSSETAAEAASESHCTKNPPSTPLSITNSGN